MAKASNQRANLHKHNSIPYPLEIVSIVLGGVTQLRATPPFYFPKTILMI